MFSELGARETLKKSQKKIEQAKVNLGEAYSVLVLGLGHRESHHTHQGRYNCYSQSTVLLLFNASFRHNNTFTIHKVEGLKNTHRSTFV